MATISKFYLHDAATTNTGTMPTGAFVADAGGDPDGDADGTTRNARLTNDVIGVLETSAVITFAATSGTNQIRGYRRFVSPPLAARTFAGADGTWTCSFACVESNTNHAGAVYFVQYLWRPSTGLRVGTVHIAPGLFNFSSTTKTTASVSGNWNGTQAILDGDIIVFEFGDTAAQSMAVAYTSTFFYDGTTEASTTSSASFITPPSALTLFTPPAAATPLPLHQSVPFYPRASRPS